MPVLEPLPSDANVIFGRWANVLVVRALSTETDHTFLLYESNLRTVLRRHPQGAGLVLLVDHEESPPDGYADRMQGLLARYGGQIITGSAVINARGFAAAVQRAVGTAVLSVSRMQGKFAIHQSVDEAVPWLAKRLWPEVGRAERSRELREALIGRPALAGRL